LLYSSFVRLWLYRLEYILMWVRVAWSCFAISRFYIPRYRLVSGNFWGPALKSRHESIWIIAGILELAKAGATTTQFARKLGLNYRAAQGYVEGLLGSSHLRKHLKSRNMVHELTEKGELFLAGLKAIKRDADEVFSPPRPSTVLAEDQSG